VPEHFFAFEIGFDPASPEATPRQVGFVFPEPEGVVHFHNPFVKKLLRSFWLFGNWV